MSRSSDDNLAECQGVGFNMAALGITEFEMLSKTEVADWPPEEQAAAMAGWKDYQEFGSGI